MRRVGLGLRTLWVCQVSKIQASPAAMWTDWLPQRNRTSGWVAMGTWIRTRCIQ
jgi:hypothetical protein